MEKSNDQRNAGISCEYLLENGALCRREINTGSRYCLEHSLNVEHDVQFYTHVVEHFRQDIREFFIRSNFYFVGETAIMYVVYSRGAPATLGDLLLSLLAVAFGITVAIYWHFVSRGAIVWMHKWRQEVIRIDKMISRFKSYSRLETEMLGKRVFYPSELTSRLPAAFLVFWTVILGYLMVTYFTRA